MAVDKNLAELQSQAEFQRKTLEQRRNDLVNEPFVVEYAARPRKSKRASVRRSRTSEANMTT